jgi:hypothetical protein
VASALTASGAAIMGVMPSPITGQAGNIEFLIHAVAHPPDGTFPSGPEVEAMVDAAVEEAHQPASGGDRQ